jgi:hypothetical protein
MRTIHQTDKSNGSAHDYRQQRRKLSSNKTASPTIMQEAYAVENYLRENDAVRIDVDTVGAYRSVFEICSDLKISSDHWRAIKNYLLSKGRHLCYKSGKGHFLGFPGEEITNDIYLFKIAKGWQKHYYKAKEAIRSASPEEQEWINRKFETFDLADEEAEEADLRSV